MKQVEHSLSSSFDGPGDWIGGGAGVARSICVVIVVSDSRIWGRAMALPKRRAHRKVDWSREAIAPQE
jgi:hypothetical protein